MTASFQLTGINDQLTPKASFAEDFNTSIAIGIFPSLKIGATGGRD